MLKQNDFQASRARGEAEEHAAEQLTATLPDHGSEHRLQGRAPRTPKRSARFRRAGVSAVAALALVGGIAGPAHAEAGGIAGSTPAQDAAESGVTAVPTETTDTGAPGTPAGENVAETLRLETERAVAAMKSARKAEAKKNSTVSKKRKAALKKAAAKQKAAVKKKATKAKKKLKKVVRSAMSQLGDFQDCTAVVERALRKAGVHAGDLGTQVGDYTELGGRKVTGKYRAGDVLIWPGRHVAVYTGKGKAVHGGWNGGRTVVNKNLQVYSKPIVVRYFKADQQAAASVAS